MNTVAEDPGVCPEHGARLSWRHDGEQPYLLCADPRHDRTCLKCGSKLERVRVVDGRENVRADERAEPFQYIRCANRRCGYTEREAS